MRGYAMKIAFHYSTPLTLTLSRQRERKQLNFVANKVIF
jgi:hypothetical protein